jgi:hypothetical protein
MSNTIAHRPQVHRVPLLPVLAVVATVLIATAAIWAINQPQTGTTTTTTQAIVLPATQQAAVAAPESPVFRHAQMRAAAAGGYPPVYVANVHHLVNGTTLGPLSTEQSTTGSYIEARFPRAGKF